MAIPVGVYVLAYCISHISNIPYIIAKHFACVFQTTLSSHWFRTKFHYFWSLLNLCNPSHSTSRLHSLSKLHYSCIVVQFKCRLIWKVCTALLHNNDETSQKWTFKKHVSRVCELIFTQKGIETSNTCLQNVKLGFKIYMICIKKPNHSWTRDFGGNSLLLNS